MAFFGRMLGFGLGNNDEFNAYYEKEKASRAKSISHKSKSNNKNNNNNTKQDDQDPSVTKREDEDDEHNGKPNNNNNKQDDPDPSATKREDEDDEHNGKHHKNNTNNNNNNNNYNNDLYRNNHGWTRKNRKAMHERTARAKEETSTFLGQLGTLRNPIPTLAKGAAAITLLAFPRPGGGTVLADSSHAVAVQGSDAVAMPVVAVVPPESSVAVVESPDGGSLVPLFQAPQPQSFPEDALQEQQPTSPLNGGPAASNGAAGAAAAGAAAAAAAAAAGSGGFSYALMGIAGAVHSFVKALFEGGKDIIDSILHKGIAALVVVSLIALCAVAFLANVFAGAILTSLVAIGAAIAYFFFKQETTGETHTSTQRTYKKDTKRTKRTKDNKDNKDNKDKKDNKQHKKDKSRRSKI